MNSIRRVFKNPAASPASVLARFGSGSRWRKRLRLAVALPITPLAAVFTASVRFATNVAWWPENAGTGWVTLTRAGTSSRAASVQWQASGGTATPGADDSPITGGMPVKTHEHL